MKKTEFFKSIREDLYWGGRLVLRKAVKLGKTLFLFLSLTLCFCDALDMDDNDEIVEAYDPLKDFAERKPWWCGGGLQVKEYKAYTNYYANFRGGCGCGETQTSMVRLSKDNSISLEERQKDAVRRVLDKVNVYTCRSTSTLLIHYPPSFSPLSPFCVPSSTRTRVATSTPARTATKSRRHPWRPRA